MSQGPSQPLRCAVCHDALSEPVHTCAGCCTALHQDCRANLAECPTLGCADRQSVAPATAAKANPRRWLRRLVLLGVLVVAGPGACSLLLRDALNPFGPRWEPALRAQLRPGPGRPDRLVDVSLGHITMIPGQSHAKVVLCDEDGDALGTYAFSTGWRLDCDSASIVQYPGRAETDLLLIECSEATFRTGPALKEYFGVTADDRLAIARLAAPDGTFAGFPDYSSGHPLGTIPPRRTSREWRDVLAGPDPISVLEALNWLGGDHLDAAFSLDRPSNVLLEPAEHAQDATAAIDDQAVRDAVRALAGSTDPWIAEAAATVLKNFDEFFKNRRERQWRDDRDEERHRADVVRGLGPPPALSDPDLSKLVANEGWIAAEMRGRSAEVATHYARALLKFRSDDHVGAIACLNSAIALDPTWDGAYSLRSSNREKLGDWEGAIADEVKAAELNPDEQNLLGVALTYRRRGDNRTALHYLDRTIEVSPNCLQARWHRADVREQLGEVDGAIAEFTWIADQRVYNEEEARNRIAALQSSRGPPGTRNSD